MAPPHLRLRLLLLAAFAVLRALAHDGPDLDVWAADLSHAPDSASANSALPEHVGATAAARSGHSAAQVPHWYHTRDTIAGDDSARLRFTAEVQHDIWRHQNPPTCEGRRYLETPYHRFGLGSLLNRASGTLGFAMNQGLIMLYHEELGSPNFLGSYCAGVLNPSCIFMPPSNCTAYARDPRNKVKIHTGSDDHSYPMPVVPDKWVQRWAETDMSSSGMVNLQYWWRAQAAGYFSRLNARTSQEMIARRLRSAARGAAPLPLPPDTIAVHVRHGDKSTEMKLASWKKHHARVDRLARQRGLNEHFIYLSTDDPDVVHAAHAIRERNYRVFSLPCPALMDGAGVLPCRTNSTSANPGYDMEEDGTHADQIALFAVESLLLALEATHFVGQRGSSWARLIDELRMVVDKACRDGSSVDIDHHDQCQCPEDAEELVG
ncbi:hypothetical protein JKP88DRAFT_349681 [Tribonema minus]|uniref:Uncharacterized protein n=1 Tax=Tribonema minus TaxID=303371 RepID=A0A835YU43_9STRA|nr:hypothetical protein JKP88DRAFT_349681 [Tribonema minus]